MKASGIITLLTDFGLSDAYVAIMKGVILSIAPRATIVDITHEVPPQSILEGAYLLQTSYRFFPPGTIHVAVVDPGVGTDRRPIAIQTDRSALVGPDNGLLAPIVDEIRADRGDVRIVELTEQKFWLPVISATFHGRDIFSPVAAHLLNGAALAELGRPIVDIRPSVVPAPTPGLMGAVEGQIIHVDRYGNCITNITRGDLDEHAFDGRLHVDIAGERLTGLYRAYSLGPVGVPMALIGSSGHLELAVCNGNAAKSLGVTAGDRLRVVRPDRA